MKAARYSTYGGPEVLEVGDVEDPVPAAGKAVVRVLRCGVNPIDRTSIAGRFGESLRLPHIPGSEIVGTVAAYGPDTTGPEQGSRVAVSSRLFCGRCRFCRAGDESACTGRLPKTPPLQIVGVATEGGYAELVVVPAQNLIALPDGVDVDQAACATVCGATARHLLERVKIRKRDRVLVVGASGGVGIFAMQLARNRGAKVVAVTSGAAKAHALDELGAEHTIDREDGPYAEQAREITDGEGVDVVVDPLGSATFEQSLAALGRKGRYATCGILTGNQVSFDLTPFYMNQLQIVGSSTASRKDLTAVLEQLAAGTIYCPVHATYPLERAAEAIAALDDPERLGKVLLEVT